MHALTLILPLLSLCFNVLGSPVTTDSTLCGNGPEVVLSETFIGENKNVKMEYISCTQSTTVEERFTSLESRQTNATNVCGANCVTNCFTPSGGGPDPNDCHIIADALRFDSQNIGAIFPIGTGTNNTIVLTFSSCETFFVNQDLGPLAYCRTDWASLIDFVAPNCQATQNAHGGNCVANDQRWFVQVQHS